MRSLLAMLLVLGAGAVHAQGWYLGADAGVARLHVDRGALDGRLAALGVAGISSSLDRDSLAVRLHAGYELNRNFAIEIGYVNLGEATYNATSTVPANGRGEASAKAAGADVLARLIIPVTARLSPYLFAGGAYMQVRGSANGSVPGIAIVATRKVSDVVPVAGVGVEARLAPSISARLQWARYFDLGDSMIGRADVSMLSAGLSARF